MVTFLVSGLWHGASWNFVIWGGLHGLYQIIGELLAPIKKKVNEVCKVRDNVFSYKFGQIFVTFLLTSFTWVFFRAKDMEQVLYFFERMTRWNPWVLFNEGLYVHGLDRVEANVLLVGLVIMLLIELLRYHKKKNFSDFLVEQNIWFIWTVLFFMIMACVIYGVYGITFDSSQFIYFQF